MLNRCAKCDRHVHGSSCPFCTRRVSRELKSAALAASLLAFGQTSLAHADTDQGGVIAPAEDAVESQVEPHYGIPPSPPPDDEPDPPDDDEDAG